MQVPEHGSEYAAEAKAVLGQVLGSGAPLLARVVARGKADAVLAVRPSAHVKSSYWYRIFFIEQSVVHSTLAPTIPRS
jgi:hypothetical protein